mgnify:CR=1 FL=1
MLYYSILFIEYYMRTTLNIDDNLFTILMNLTRAKTKTEAVRSALVDYIKLKKKEKLLDSRGQLSIEDVSEKLRLLEMNK